MCLWKSAVAALCLVVLCAVRPAAAGPSYEVFAESLNVGGWQSTPWGATVSAVNAGTTTAPVFKGPKVAKVNYTAAMGVFKQTATDGFSTGGYRNFTFAVYNAGNADDLWFVAETTGGQLGNYLRIADYTPYGYFPVQRWTWVRIPVYYMGLGFAPHLKYFSVASGKSGATAYFDDVQFSSNVTLYEGVRYKIPFVASTYDSLTAPGNMLWSWGVTLSSAASYSGDIAFRFTTTGTWGGGIQFAQVMPDLYSHDFGGVTVRFRSSAIAYGCQHTIRMVNSDWQPTGSTVCVDAYQPANVPYEAGDWQQITIPMSAFMTSPTFLSGLIFESSLKGDRVDVSDVRLVQKLSWMMPTILRSAAPNSFGQHWQSGYCDDFDGEDGYRKIHVGTDYTDADNEDREVRAASRGIVRRVIDLGYWAWAVIVYHEADFATSYLHLKDPYVQEGDEVQRGSLLGVTANIQDNTKPISHLHFGVRIAPYNELLSKAGALPEQSCSVSGIAYPGIWQSFISSERLDW